MAQILHPARPRSAQPGERVVFRHRLSMRLWHWRNAIILLVMLMSGLMIFNAHPRLYWGQYGANPDPAWLEIGSHGQRDFLRVGDLSMDTTCALGVWSHNGQLHDLAFPSWATIPSTYNLALSRHWHLTFAWLLVGAIVPYGIWSLINGHLRRHLAPRPAELKHCADDFSGTPYYESIDLNDAFHPQTLLAYGMNGTDLPTGHGAPLRLRVERQLGYKQAKFIMRAEAVASLDRIGAGRGCFWEDAAGYYWYAGA